MEFQIGLQGAIIVNAMTVKNSTSVRRRHAGHRLHVPQSPDRGGTDIRSWPRSEHPSSSETSSCRMTRRNSKTAGAVAWMQDKDTASPHGSCTDRFARFAFKQRDHTENLLNQNTR